ncbi:hypothetical protein [Cohnella cholangitidis]|uniref:Uncharacterized protein n=1 Tax=Cohnella cholangitidis TaxID=2598458 RepID=A0A7G5BU69_9BACL|nr:hypothetical protein [Cohnella cholangitidis]QMV40503.1 hypothetical protein FPL14_04245 [Cohnella cholangitidis]
MDNEVSHGIHLTVNMVIIAAIVAMLALFITLGQNFGRNAQTVIADNQASAYAAELRAMRNYESSIPAASAYILLTKNVGAVRSISGAAFGVSITSIEDLTRIMDNKVRLRVEPVTNGPEDASRSDFDYYTVEVTEG